MCVQLDPKTRTWLWLIPAVAKKDKCKRHSEPEIATRQDVTKAENAPVEREDSLDTKTMISILRHAMIPAIEQH